MNRYAKKFMNKCKNIGQSLIICMAMYSIIPMPMIQWEERSMKYILGFLPMVGVIIGGCMYGIYQVLGGFTPTFQTVVLLLVPIIVSGGIHLDGLIDTCDAYFSYGDKEKKLEILKDPRTGAFGVIGAIVYFLGLYAVYTQILANKQDVMMILPFVFVISRSVGAFCMIRIPNAKKDGLGASFSNSSSEKRVCVVLAIWLISVGIILWMIQKAYCMIFIAIVIILLCCLIPIYMKKFGGITGDLTGFIISSLELLLPLGIAIGGGIL